MMHRIILIFLVFFVSPNKTNEDGINGTFAVETTQPMWQTSLNYTTAPVLTTYEATFQPDRDKMELEPNMTSYDFLAIQKPKISTIKDDICYHFGSCEKHFNNIGSWFCHCDDKCNKYGDCCLEYVERNYTEKNETPFKLGCLKRNSNNKDPFGYSLIADCPRGYEENSTIDRCKQKNILENGPPVVDKRSVVYNNKFCALCHNLTETTAFSVQFYNFKDNILFFANLSRYEKLRFAFKHASYKLKPPMNTETRTCVVNVIENDHFLCNQYTNPVMVLAGGDFEMYKNYFCIPSYKKSGLKICLAEVYDGGDLIDSIFSMSVIFSFNEAPSIDVETSKCEKWTDEMTVNQDCSGLETYLNVTIDIEYYLVSESNITFEEMRRYAILSAWSYEVRSLTQLTNYLKMETNKENTIAKVVVSVKYLKRCFLNELKSIENTLHERNINILVKDNVTREWMTISSSSKLYKDKKVEAVQFENRWQELVIRIFNLGKSLHGIDLLNQTIKNIQAGLQLTVLRESTGKLYLESITYLDGHMKGESKSRLLSILTYSCFSVSVVALICLIIINRKQNLISNIPGSNLENLCVSLIISNLLFMLGIGAYKTSTLCYIIGIVLHYLWLTVFSFMTISVMYIVTNIVRMKSRHENNVETTTRQRRKITIAGLLVPLLLVGPAIAVDRWGPTNMSPGYGGRVCFPIQFPANVVFFSGPVMLSVATNLICLVHIIFQICRVKYCTRHMRTSDPYEDAKMYLRIIILSGVFWITGIVAVLWKSEELEYVFTLLCGLQGFFVSVANLTTSRAKCGASKRSTFTLQKGPPKTEERRHE